MTITLWAQDSTHTAAFLPDEQATAELGARLAPHLAPGMTVFLCGDLGAGKTTLVRGVLRALGYSGPVRSPTFSLVELYELSSLYLYHFDFYRFANPIEFADAGFRDHFGGGGVCLVEWPERAGELLPGPDLRISLSEHAGGRLASIEAATESGRQCLRQLSGARG